jgi:hypothetical protein
MDELAPGVLFTTAFAKVGEGKKGWMHRALKWFRNSSKHQPQGGCMKSKIYGVLTMLAASLVLALPTLNAQSRLVGDVPFGFYAGEKAMAAGSYQVEPNDASVEILQNVDTDAAAFLLKAVLVQDKEASGPKLVFEKCGDQYFLIQIWDGTSNTGIQLPRSKREKESLVASDGPANGSEIIVLAMNRE